MAEIERLMGEVNSFVWGPVMLFFLVGTGVYLTIRLKFLPWRNLPTRWEGFLTGGIRQREI